MRTAIATPEAIAQAIDDLAEAQLEPTVERVRQRIGGGSYSTINKLLADELTRRRKDAMKTAELPPEMARFGAELGTRIAAEIHQFVNAAADARIAQAQTEAKLSVDAANAALAEAVREVERLESQLESSNEALIQATADEQQAFTRVAVAEGRVSELTREIDRQTKALAAADEAKRQAIEAAAQLRGQVATLEKLVKTREEKAHRPTRRG